MADAIVRMIGNKNGGIYFDAVLDNDMKPLFNGTPQDTGQWLKDHPEAHIFSVCVGRTMHLISVPSYLNGVS